VKMKTVSRRHSSEKVLVFAESPFADAEER
jgi:hypothetical protein